MPRMETYKQLAQRHLRSTADTILYRPPTDSTTTFVKVIVVCNTTGSAATYSIWVNPVSNVSGDDYALVKQMPIAARASDQRIYSGDSGIILKGTSASILVAGGAASAITVTLYGVEVEET
jgi:hypothetical protein